ncbi:uncharacterized protein [Eurosta solidaginis]|uniref:uncharacterized protein isoform X2 n=1 Tax=Eurosta solidaginis TaxID=178769 RepID=UPI003530EA2E
MSPLSTVEMPSFRKLIDDILSKDESAHMKHLSRRTVGKHIQKRFIENMDELRSILKNVDYVCTTADVWSSSTRRFLGVTAHWIDSKTFTIKSATIACRRFSGTYDRIAELLHEIHLSFGLDSKKLVSIVTDNGSNLAKACNEFGIKIPLLTHDVICIIRCYILYLFSKNSRQLSTF